MSKKNNFAFRISISIFMVYLIILYIIFLFIRLIAIFATTDFFLLFKNNTRDLIIIASIFGFGILLFLISYLYNIKFGFEKRKKIVLENEAFKTYEILDSGRIIYHNSYPIYYKKYDLIRIRKIFFMYELSFADHTLTFDILRMIIALITSDFDIDRRGIYFPSLEDLVAFVNKYNLADYMYKYDLKKAERKGYTFVYEETDSSK